VKGGLAHQAWRSARHQASLQKWRPKAGRPGPPPPAPARPPHLGERLHAAARGERRDAAGAAQRRRDADRVRDLARRRGARREQRVDQPVQPPRGQRAAAVRDGGEQCGDGGVEVRRQRQHGRPRQPVQHL
jgi:hypothetical protein